MTLNQEKTLHYFVFGLMVGLIIASIGYACLSAGGYLQGHVVSDEYKNVEGSGQKKLLPDFVVDTVPSDELEMLKP